MNIKEKSAKLVVHEALEALGALQELLLSLQMSLQDEKAEEEDRLESVVDSDDTIKHWTAGHHDGKASRLNGQLKPVGEALEAVGDLVYKLGVVHAFGVFAEEEEEDGKLDPSMKKCPARRRSSARQTVG